MELEKATLSIKLIDAIAQYLAQRPYAEAYQLIHAIQSEVVPQAEAAKKDVKPVEGAQ